jgi:hypothetical protein
VGNRLAWCFVAFWHFLINEVAFARRGLPTNQWGEATDLFNGFDSLPVDV